MHRIFTFRSVSSSSGRAAREHAPRTLALPSALIVLAGLSLPAAAQANPPPLEMAKPQLPTVKKTLNDRFGPDQKARAKALREKAGVPTKREAKTAQVGGDDVQLAQVQGTPPPVRNCRQRKGKLYFRFNEANILDVLKQVSQYTCKNFIVSEGIKGAKKEITIISHRPVTVNQAYAAFLSALEANNMALIPAGRFYKLVERKDAVRDALPMYQDKGTLPYSDAQVTLLYELQNVSKENVQPILRNLMSKAGDIQLIGDNLMIITDSSSNVRRLVKLLDKIDVAGAAAGNRIHVVDIEYADVAQVTQKLNDIFAQANTRGGASKPKKAAGDGASDNLEDVAIEKIVADERTSKLIIIASIRAFERVKEVIEILDVPGDDLTSGSKVYVHPLNNADAQKAASTLSGVTQNSSKRNNAKNKKQAGPAELFEGEVKVTADESTNSLVIISSPRDYRAMAKVIDQLDVKRPQVFVEAAILEVSLTQTRRFQLDTYGGLPVPVPGFSDPGLGIIANEGGQQLITSSAQALASQELFTQLNAQTLDASNLAGVVDAASSLESLLGWLAFRGPALESDAFGFPIPSFGVVLNALQTNSNVDVLSTPHIMTTDNEAAEISVGERIPVVRGIAPAGGGIGGAFGGLQQVAYEDVKLKFKVTPHVNVDDDIRLEIEQEVSDLGGSVPVGNGLNQPIITNRSAKTTVVVKDQQTVILGGLISNRKSDSESKFPFLGDLPIVGWLFKQWRDEDTKTNLLLVLTPYVVRSREDFANIYERKIQERRDFVEAFFGSSAQYNPYIDYRKKTGPVARLIDDVETEMSKIENGGPGLPGEVAITPEAPIVPFEVDESSDNAAGDATGETDASGDVPPPPAEGTRGTTEKDAEGAATKAKEG